MKKFSLKLSPVQIDKVAMENNNECKAQIMDYLKGSPDLTVYYYKPWGDEQRTKLHTILQDLTGNPGSSYTNATNPPKATPTEEKPKSAIQPNKDFDTPKTESKSESGNDEDMEKWLNGVS